MDRTVYPDRHNKQKKNSPLNDEACLSKLCTFHSKTDFSNIMDDSRVDTINVSRQ